jgi:hypothetical protein
MGGSAFSFTNQANIVSLSNQASIVMSRALAEESMPLVFKTWIRNEVKNDNSE